MSTRGPMYGGMGGLAAGGGADPAPVTPPAATSEAVASGGSPAAKTFGAFTDPDARISSYSAAITNAVGSTAIASGSGLGAYAVTGSADGDGYVLALTALDSEGEPLATAVHVVDIALPDYPALVPPSAPAAQALASGTTSSSAISWGSPTGGSGSTTTADVLTQDVGSGASLSAGAVIGLEDGDVVRVRRTWTDSTTGQTVSATTTVSVAAAAGGAYDWVTKADLDLSAADLAGPWSSGTNNITTGSGATTIATVTVTRSGSTSGNVQVTADGLTTTGVAGTGNVNAAINLDTLLSTDDAFFTAGDVLVQIAVTGFSISTTGYMLIGVSPLAVQGTGFVGLFLNSAGVGAADLSWYYDATSGSVFTAASTLSSFVLDLRIMNGRFARAKVTAGTTTFSDPADVTSMSHPGSALQSAASSQVFGSNFNLLCSVKHICTGTISRVRVSRLEAV
jgi:hypothetical protein